MKGLGDRALTETLRFNSHCPSPVPDERRFTTTVGLTNAFLFQWISFALTWTRSRKNNKKPLTYLHRCCVVQCKSRLTADWENTFVLVSPHRHWVHLKYWRCVHCSYGKIKSLLFYIITVFRSLFFYTKFQKSSLAWIITLAKIYNNSIFTICPQLQLMISYVVHISMWKKNKQKRQSCSVKIRSLWCQKGLVSSSACFSTQFLKGGAGTKGKGWTFVKLQAHIVWNIWKYEFCTKCDL